MTEYCEICAEELNPNEEEEGIYNNCKNAKEKYENEYEKDEEFIYPGVT